MYSYHIKEMAVLVAQALEIDTPENLAAFPEQRKKDMETIQKAIASYWDGKMAISWDIDDVLERAKETGITLTSDQAKEVLDEAEHRFDANVGINWYVLDEYIEGM